MPRSDAVNLKAAFLFWLIMVVIAIINGTLVNSVVSRVAGDYGSHLYRTFFIITVIFVFSRIYLLKTGGPGQWHALALSAGVLWFASSLIFEFIFGHYLFGLPWEKIASEYDITRGRLWALVLASELAAPLINARLLER